MVVRAAKREIDLSGFPAGSTKQVRRFVCLACIFDIFTKQLKMSPRAAYTAVRGHEPTVEEITGTVARPYFDAEEKSPHCPYCDSSKRWLAILDVIRIEGSRATTEARKELLKKLPKSEGQVLALETKANRRDLLFEWLETLGAQYDFDDPAWLIDCARAYLEKREPKTDWEEVFDGLNAVRKSQRLEGGWEREGSRLYLAPELYYEVLLVQYLVSRSHKSGGLTFEGRLTIAELLRRLRGYVRHHEISGDDPLEFLQNLVDGLDPGGASMKVVYIIDRREFLEKAKEVYGKYAS